MSTTQKTELKNSILVRYGLIMVVFVMLSMASMVSSVLIAESLENDAAKINLAGSLRMQSYRIAQSLLLQSRPGLNPELSQLDAEIQTFDAKLNNHLLSILTKQPRSDALYISYQALSQQWQLLRSRLQVPVNSETQLTALLDNINVFVDTADQLVYDLQVSSENKIKLLRMLQGFTLLATLITVSFALFNLSTYVIEPLRRMVSVANRMRQGDFSQRINYRVDDELGVLASSMNNMADALSSLYNELETRVEEKTAHLSNANQALELLYQTSMSLPENPNNVERLRQTLDELEGILQAGKLSLCLSTPEHLQAFKITPFIEQQEKVNCVTSDCAHCKELHTPPGWLSENFPITKHGVEFGQLSVQHDRDQPLQKWQLRVLRIITEVIASAFTLAVKSDQEHHLAVMEERAVIARELHDSLAQSLSYLKMQMTRLEKLRQREDSEEKQTATIEDIKTGLSDAYRQLRELLTTFRLQLKEPGLKPALQGTVAEFSEKAQIPISLNFELEHVPLTPNEEVHVLQVVREALSNVNRHSKASSAWVEIQQENQQVEVIIRDNGLGLQESGPGSHYGTTIMNERATSLDGEITIENGQQSGTIVALRFTPAFLNTENNATTVENYEPLKHSAH